EGELEIGQVSGMIKEIKPVADIIDEIMGEFEIAKKEVAKILL
ncbi:MAG: nitronate monooxygenase, partial [Bacteroidetes bacterium]